jgi:cytochrome P450
MTRLHVPLTEFLDDPFGSLARARSAGGLTDFGLALGIVAYDDVRALLTDSTRLRADFSGFLRTLGITSGAFYDWMAISPLNKDGAEHLRWRALMSRTFTPRRVEQLRPFLTRAAHELIDGFATRGECEFMAEFADAYPSLGLCELIGVPVADRDRFRGWANTIGLGFSPVELVERIGEVDTALTALVDYTGELAEARRKDPRDDLVTRIAQAAHEDGWSTDEVRGFIAGLVFAGHETTKNQLGWTVAVLADRPDVWDAVARRRPDGRRADGAPRRAHRARYAAHPFHLGRRSRRSSVSRSGTARRRGAPRRPARRLRLRPPPLPRRGARARRAAGGARRPGVASHVPVCGWRCPVETGRRHHRAAAAADQVRVARPLARERPWFRRYG